MTFSKDLEDVTVDAGHLESQAVHKAPISPSLPPRSASSTEVREYIKDLLTTKHGLTPQYATEVADKWKVLRGWSLRGMTYGDFIQRFGKSAEPHLFWDVKEAREAADDAYYRERLDAWNKSHNSRNYQCM